MKQLKSQPKDYFGREKLREDLDKISKVYMDQGYAYTEVDPGVKREVQDRTDRYRFQCEKEEHGPYRQGHHHRQHENPG